MSGGAGRSSIYIEDAEVLAERLDLRLSQFQTLSLDSPHLSPPVYTFLGTDIFQLFSGFCSLI